VCPDISSFVLTSQALNSVLQLYSCSILCRAGADRIQNCREVKTTALS
jgi:hypothetical protein